MAKRVPKNGTGRNLPATRYWISFDLGLMGNYGHVYEWLDSLGAQECGSGVATITSSKTRDQIAAEIQRLLENAPRARAYVISMKQGGRFIVGGRRAAPWEGFATRTVSMEDEA